MTPDQEKEFEELKKSQRKMGDALEKIMTAMQETNSKLDSVYYALVGNEIRKDGGMAQAMIEMGERLDELEDKFDKMQKEYDKIVAKARGVIVGAVFAGSIIGYLIQYIVNHL